MKREGKTYDDVYDNGNDAEKEGSVSREASKQAMKKGRG